MAHFVMTNAAVSVASTSLSDHVRSVTFEYSAEMVDDTAMGDTTKIRLGGLKDWTVTLEFAQDFAASEVDATLFALVGASAALKIKPVNTSIGATNPEYQMTGIMESYQPIKGSVGELATTTATFQCAGAVTRAVV